MEIYNPEEIFPNKSLRKTLNFIQQGIDNLNAKELNQTDRSKIIDALMVPHIRKSLGIEDIRTSVRQTKDVLDFYRQEGEIREGKDNQEIVNLQDANDFICSEEGTNSKLSVDFIKKIHYLVTKDTKVRDPGRFKDRQNEFRDGMETAIPMKVNEFIETIGEYFEASEQQNPIVLACWLHHQIAKVHPFNDGNGRTARTLQDWVLFKNKYLPCSTGSITRQKYYDILEQADEGHWEDLIEQVTEAQSDSLALAMQTIETSEISAKRINLVTRLFTQKQKGVDEEEYAAWRYQAKRLVSSFEDECEKLNDALVDAGAPFWIKYIPQDIISKEAWKIVISDGFANRNNAFVINFFKDRDCYYKSIGYFAKHFRRDSDNAIPMSSENVMNSVSLYLGGHDEPAEVDQPYKAKKLKIKRTGQFITELPWDDQRIAVREVLFNSSSFYKFRNTTRWVKEEYLQKDVKLDFDSEFEHWVMDETQPEDVASEYVSDILIYKGGLES